MKKHGWFAALLLLFGCIPKCTQKLVFNCVGFAVTFLSSLTLCSRTKVLAPEQKTDAASLLKPQLLSAFRYSHKQSAVQQAVDGLSPYQRGALELFFRTLVTETAVGYTLYGDKPLSDEGYSEEEVLISLSEHRFAKMGLIYKIGVQTWETSNLPEFTKDFEIRVSNVPSYGWHEIAFIHVPTFLEVATKNIALFQYVLGPKMSPQVLLERFRDRNENLSMICNDNWTLNGIILGFGTYNSLMGSRSEYLQGFLLSHDPSMPAIHRDTPSFGFLSLEDEVNQLNKDVLYTVNHQSPRPTIPWYGSYDHPESQALLARYQETLPKLKTLLSEKDFLGKVLSKIFCESIVVGESPPFVTLLEKELAQKEHLSSLLGQAIWRSLGEVSEAEIDAFVRGMKEAGSTPLVSLQQARKECLDAKNNGTPKELLKKTEALYVQFGNRTWSRYRALEHLVNRDQVIKSLLEAKNGYALEALRQHEIAQLELLSWLTSEM